MCILFISTSKTRSFKPWVNFIGRVKLGIHRYTGEHVAIKIISKAFLAANPTIEKAVRREIAIMKLIRHPNVVGLLDVIDDEASPNLYVCFSPLYPSLIHSLIHT